MWFHALTVLSCCWLQSSLSLLGTEAEDSLPHCRSLTRLIRVLFFTCVRIFNTDFCSAFLGVSFPSSVLTYSEHQAQCSQSLSQQWWWRKMSRVLWSEAVMMSFCVGFCHGGEIPAVSLGRAGLTCGLQGSCLFSWPTCHKPYGWGGVLNAKVSVEGTRSACVIRGPEGRRDWRQSTVHHRDPCFQQFFTWSIRIDDARTFKIQLPPKGQAIATLALNDGFRGWNFRARTQELFFSAVHLDTKPWFLQFLSHLSGFME